MRIRKENVLLYAVTDRTWEGNKLVDQVEEAVKSGVTMLQLREKGMGFEDMVEEARHLKTITDRFHIPFIINDSIDVAIAVNADGIHLGQEDEGIREARAKLGNDKIIGISAHTLEEAITAQEEGADYIGVGAVFETTTKKDASGIGLEILKLICEAVTIPVVAIGGISKDNIMRLSGTGVDGVAVISALFAQPDIKEATKQMLQLAQIMVEHNPQDYTTDADEKSLLSIERS
jgi:thiamine-phosphate pyrophosphorylase